MSNYNKTTVNILDELISLHDQDFVQSAYQILLGRAPDPEGLHYYLTRIRKGISKEEILAQLGQSSECKSRKVKIAGLNKLINRHRRLKTPFLGIFFRLLGPKKIERDIQQYLHAIVNKLYEQDVQLQQRFDEINWTVSQLRQLVISEKQSLVEQASQKNNMPCDKPSSIKSDKCNLPSSFDAKWYLKQYPDVAESGMDPYVHYINQGKAEARHPAFDSSWYLSQYPDVAESGMDTYAHYINQGKEEGRHPAFDSSWYLSQYLDVAENGIDPYEHYIHFGKIEGRYPAFDRNYYLKQYPDVRLAGIDPYNHYINNGKQEGRAPSGDQRWENWSLMLPETSTKLVERIVPKSIIDIVIPVYRGLDQTSRCIYSVLNSKVKTPFRLIVINDASPENEITEFLQRLSFYPQLIVIENPKNLGFTATVNRGMTWSDKNDVVLLNSDTEVANDWLDKLAAQAYSVPRVGSVTPFSNNATICNYPTLDGMKELPNGESVQSLDWAFSNANKGRSIHIPTAVGFCMYIRRDCLSEVGLFDVETFGKGYGEENDFCLRATAKGWKHLLAADTFVFHEGEVSFQEDSNPRKERAMNILRERYPEYEADVIRHIAKNEAYPLRIAATAARFRQGNLPVVLHVLHNLGGGTEKHVEELCRTHYGKARLLIMSPAPARYGKHELHIRSADSVDELDIHLPTSNLDFLVSLIQSFGVSLIHVHHVFGYFFDLQYLVKKLRIQFYLTVHDYMLICPRINLVANKQRYCGEPEPVDCNRCLSVGYPLGAVDIIWWRESHAWLFNDAAAVICPSHDVAQRCHRYYPNAVYRVVAHEQTLSDNYFDINVPELNENEPLRVAILGVLASHKGMELIAEALSVTQQIRAPLQFQLIGYAIGNMPPTPDKLFSQTGQYVDSELVDKINTFNPHLILFPAGWPETYSYTLTAALKSKRPVMVSNIGALPERVAQRSWTWLMDWNISATQLVDKLCKVRTLNFYTRTAPILPQKNESNILIALEYLGFYENGYLSDLNNLGDKAIIDIRVPGKITALVLLENVGVQPSPCAYIRLILPLIREHSEKFDFRWVSPELVTHYVADVLISQRTAVTTIAAIDKIVAHCRESNIRIVYDIDDLLLTLPEDHPEHAIYAPKSAAVFRWLLEANEVWVSTEALRHEVFQINPRTHVVPNYIDDKLWIKAKMSAVKRDPKDPVRILYMGTQTHSADFELVKNVLKRLRDEFSTGIEINLIGILPNASSEEFYKTITPPQGIGSSYPAFVNWICNEPTFDIGIAPLVDNDFNRCKSAIKFMDYSALGLASVASDLNGYVLIRNGENGFRVKNTEDSWYTALKTLITDSSLRSRMQLKAQKEIFERFGYGSVTDHRVKLLTLLLLDDVKKIEKVKESIFRKFAVNNEKSTMNVTRNMISSAFLTGVGIEVGALHNPLPVHSDVTVRYVDRMDKPSLYEQYPELSQYKLVDVDFVDDGETLLTFTENSQDFIIANHFLEHCEDPISTLKAFFRVLRTGGVVFLALPDKRFTFDKNRQRTCLEHLIRDYLEGSGISRFEHFREWTKFVEPQFGRVYATKEEIESRAHELMNQNYSIHYHVWEPIDVNDMLRYCADKQGVPLVIEYFLHNDDEMIFILRKKP